MCNEMSTLRYPLSAISFAGVDNTIYFSILLNITMFNKKESANYSNIKSLDRLDTFIGRTTNIKGNIATQGSIRIDGKIEGNVQVSEAVITGPESLIKGNVNCKDAIIAGRIEGSVYAQETVELQSGASIMGDINCGNLIIGKNCFFEGKCHMAGKEAGKI